MRILLRLIQRCNKAWSWEHWLPEARKFPGRVARTPERQLCRVIISNVQYDWKQDQSKGVFPDSQVPIKKEKKGEEKR